MKISIAAEVVALARGFLGPLPSESADDHLMGMVAREMEMLGYDEVRRDQHGAVVGSVVGCTSGPDVHFVASLVLPPRDAAHSLCEANSACVEGLGAARVSAVSAAIVALGTLRRGDIAGTLLLTVSVGPVTHVRWSQHPGSGGELGAIVWCEPTTLCLGVAAASKQLVARVVHSLAAAGQIAIVYDLPAAGVRRPTFAYGPGKDEASSDETLPLAQVVAAWQGFGALARALSNASQTRSKDD